MLLTLDWCGEGEPEIRVIAEMMRRLGVPSSTNYMEKAKGAVMLRRGDQIVSAALVFREHCWEQCLPDTVCLDLFFATEQGFEGRGYATRLLREVEGMATEQFWGTGTDISVYAETSVPVMKRILERNRYNATYASEHFVGYEKYVRGSAPPWSATNTAPAFAPCDSVRP